MATETNNLNLIKLFSIVALATSLAACGGGGSSATDAATPAPAPAPVPLPAPAPSPSNPDLVTAVTPPTYVAGTIEWGAWDVLMKERQSCGFGLVQQDTRLDAASIGHAQFLAKNSAELFVNYTGHGEDPAKPYFIGNGPLDRAVSKGFPNVGGVDVAEILTASTSTYVMGGPVQYPSNEARGAASIRTLMGTVYHLTGAMWPGRIGGVGADHQFGSKVSGAFTYSLEAYRFGMLVGWTSNNPQRLGSGNVATYPCATATAAVASWHPAQESPNPFPDVTDVAVSYGTPIYLRSDEGQVMSVTSANVTASNGSVVAVRQVSKSNDPAHIVGGHEWFIVPSSPLSVGATYNVSVVGTLDGVAFTKAFSFTPAPSP